MGDTLIRLLTRDGTLRGLAANTTDLCREICASQGCDPTASVALGRLITGAALMSGLLKGDQRLALSVEGNGPLQRLNAETDAEGHIRANVRNPLPGLPPKDDRFDVVGAVGRAGFLHVIKDLGLREPYRGTVQLVSSEIGEDLAYYLTTSEQIPSAVALGVALDQEGLVDVAGGFILQSLPPGDEERVAEIERRLSELPPVTTLLRGGNNSPLALLEPLLTGIPFDIKAEQPLMFRCNCSRPQVERMLRGLSQEERKELAQRTEDTVVTCEFCRRNYAFTPEEVRRWAE
ncbi:Hsp33 family molecular chaperone HslO [Geoalkalibacter subterraneus]|jgi:molecular chaperone Hsp33|uniref:33 kDa chaperonin n=1 Tax=Geoalkalibacter subterraneus TaxID=483547 RepID=A0A0B5FDN1_9BACT|nr:Hsp33 family molecular chaperone HslO [Geoalkalibacter subterraneus]AJF05413.1 heat shock protein Hsp33 [Geoalkalibacter subterraneus]